jgi:CMP-N,N'-diacetyllegionaminic acid synthase
VTETALQNRTKRLALIPARSGSKRLSGKNIRPLGGHPLIAWTIRAAIASACFDRIIVSTDSSEIAGISIRYGAEAPFLRPQELSTDEARTVDVVLHVLETLTSEEGFVAEEMCILQPTSPYRTAEDIARSYDLFREKEANAVISVAACTHSPAWTNTLGPGGSMEAFVASSHVNMRSQELPAYYRLNGAIYWYKAGIVRECKTTFPKTRIYAYEMDELRSLDIDTLLDFEYAGFLLERGRVPGL